MKQMNNSPIIIKAIRFATEAHKGQERDDGRPFILHPEKTADILELVTDDANLIAAGWLHDTVEDTDVTYTQLVEEFGKDVADLVREVTKIGIEDSVGYYFPFLKTQRGIMLKFADRLSNVADMNTWGDKRKAHYLRKSKFWKSDPRD